MKLRLLTVTEKKSYSMIPRAGLPHCNQQCGIGVTVEGDGQSNEQELHDSGKLHRREYLRDKKWPGMLTVSNSHTYKNGGTFISGGTLKLVFWLIPWGRER